MFSLKLVVLIFVLGQPKVLGDHRGGDWVVESLVFQKRFPGKLGSSFGLVERSQQWATEPGEK